MKTNGLSPQMKVLAIVKDGPQSQSSTSPPNKASHKARTKISRLKLIDNTDFVYHQYELLN